MKPDARPQQMLWVNGVTEVCSRLLLQKAKLLRLVS